MEPVELVGASDLTCLGGVVVAPGSPTCFAGEAGKARSEYDYFFADKRISNHFGVPTVDEDSDTRPHRPVRATVSGGLHAYTGVYLVLPKPFPLKRLVGPPPPPPAWDGFADRCNGLKQAFLAGREGEGAAVGELQHFWAEWCGKAEVELGGIHDRVGHELAKSSGRGRPPRLARKPCLGWKGHLKFATTTPRGLLLRWLETRMTDVAALTAKLRSGRCSSAAAWWRCSAHRRALLVRIGLRFSADDRATVGHPWVDRVTALASVDVVHGVADLAHLGALDAVGTWLAELRGEVRREEAVARTARATRWREFARSATEGSARVGHRWYKGALAWSPESVPTVDDDGDVVLSYSSEAIAEHSMNEWAGIWGVGRSPGAGSVMSEERFNELLALARSSPLEGISVDQFRTVCSTFPAWTGLGADGWHPRQWAQLDDAACESLISIIGLIECLLVWPSATREVVFARIPKQGGGHRLIGLLTSLYRVWAKLRRPLCTSWESDNERGWDYAAVGKGALAGAWDLSLEVEAASSVGMHTAAYLSDLSKFYEYIPHAVVLEKQQS